jgi:hypothetical protein
MKLSTVRMDFDSLQNGQKRQESASKFNVVGGVMLLLDWVNDGKHDWQLTEMCSPLLAAILSLVFIIFFKHNPASL